MSKMYECISCGAKTSVASEDGRMKQLVDGDGNPVGCVFCGETGYRPIIEQLPPEEPPARSEGSSDE